jgi:hypothetical protein
MDTSFIDTLFDAESLRVDRMREHLRSRKCNHYLYPDMGIDKNVVVFSLYNFGGKRTGSLYYRPNAPKNVRNDEKGKYYTYITKGEVGVFGLESINFSREIILVSGVFKATALHMLGYTALHVSSVSPRVLRAQLSLLGRPYFAIGDNDAEGAEFVRRWGGFQSPVDVDEMSFLEIEEMLLNAYK